jgi:hypothetical protein
MFIPGSHRFTDDDLKLVDEGFGCDDSFNVHDSKEEVVKHVFSISTPIFYRMLKMATISVGDVAVYR